MDYGACETMVFVGTGLWFIFESCYMPLILLSVLCTANNYAGTSLHGVACSSPSQFYKCIDPGISYVGIFVASIVIINGML